MKLVRYGQRGRETPGLIDGDGAIRDLSAHLTDIDAGAMSPEGLARLRAIDPASLPLAGGSPRLGVPVAGVGKFAAIGLNYTDHAAEVGAPIPGEPVIFGKAISALSGPDDPVVLPRDCTQGDWEAELAIVIGTTAKYVSEQDALAHVAGYSVFNDVSERAFQIERGGQWIKGKSCDTFGPMGPWLVTADEVPDPQALHIWLDLNGERMQDSNTARMIFPVATLVSYVSRFMTLNPCDVIPTGTPPGVGKGRKPPRFLKAGDVMTVGIDGLGEQRQEVRAPE